ncbi:MAG: peptide/nickel transport system substrate-binding protein [Candidatus Paceibacteria bacterium]
MKNTSKLLNKKIRKQLAKLASIIKSLSLTEKAIFSVFALLFIISSLSALLKVNAQFLVEIPRFGGSLKEGVIGTPRFINPVLALSETDRDLSTLVYSGLMRITPEGELITDLAEEYSISEDGLEYTFKIKENAKFHDGEKVTTEDIIFTISRTQDPTIKSPKRANWDSVIVEQVSDMEIKFVLSQQYSPFIFNTTMGILPKHLWEKVTSDEFAFTIFNTEPIGSGPYRVDGVKENSTGIATQYSLKAFDDFVLGKPYIEDIKMYFFKNEEELLLALDDEIITSAHSISPSSALSLDEDYRVERVTLPRIFGVFFNQSQAPVLANKGVRNALNTAISKQSLIDEVLKGFGQISDSPIPPSTIPYETLADGEEGTEINHTDEAIEILIDNGWDLNDEGVMQKKNEILSFSISTANVPELIQVAEVIVRSWRDIGADVELKVFEPNDLNQNVIRARKYDALLFGEIIGRDLDLYAFWHSSQRNDPGLNIADYANIDVDKLIEKARVLDEKEERIETYREIEKNIIKDIPAVFLYSPFFTYVVPEELKGKITENITTPSERFLNINEWYLVTDTVWSMFKKN